jgi:uncharacterized protein YbjT (DUF2867 family)
MATAAQGVTVVAPRGDLHVVVFGATGLAGSGVLQACLDSSAVASVVAVARRPIGVSSGKLQEVMVGDFADLSSAASRLANIDACFYCLGTASSGVSEPDYRRITKSYALEAARVLKESSPRLVFHFISGNGTCLDSRFMWARVKAETEEALKASGLAGVILYRPGMILSDRLPSRAPLSLRATYPLLRLLRFIRAWSIDAQDLGRAMLQMQVERQTTGTLENLAIRAAADRYRGAAGV